MKFIIIAHPDFLNSQSMTRYANALCAGLQNLGCDVVITKPNTILYNMPLPQKFKKWLGYIDQYLIFPQKLKKIVKKNKDAFYIIADNALGPFVPYVKNCKHVVHCHDFIAQQSALGEISGITVSSTGKKYQQYIYKGYIQAKNFICISQLTKNDLLKLLPEKPKFCEVVYNALTREYKYTEKETALTILQQTIINLKSDFWLHVGGNQWYKNRIGVVKIFENFKSFTQSDSQLLLIGQQPDAQLQLAIEQSNFRKDILIFVDANDATVNLAYCAAKLFLFPSIIEGFGLPIVEALKQKCMVVIPDKAPMNEAGGAAALYIPSANSQNLNDWAVKSAKIIINELNNVDKNDFIKNSITQVQNFEPSVIYPKLLDYYNKISEDYQNGVHRN